MLVVRKLKAHNHSCSRTYRLLSCDKQTTAAHVRHVPPDAGGTTAAVCEFEFDLGSNRGTLKTSPFQLSRTSHIAPSTRVYRGEDTAHLFKMNSPWRVCYGSNSAATGLPGGL